MTQQIKFLRYPDLRDRGIGYSPASLWRLEKANRFPRRAKLGRRDRHDAAAGHPGRRADARRGCRSRGARLVAGGLEGARGLGGDQPAPARQRRPVTARRLSPAYA